MDHYFSATPDTPDKRRLIEFSINGIDYQFEVSSGVFSAKRLDPGTAVLLRKAPRPGRGIYLDLGCGYGPIGCVLADQSPGITVYAVDVNPRALDLVRENADRLGLGQRVIASRPEDVPPDVIFDGIYSNPPIRIGKDALHDLLRVWLPRLGSDGEAWLVVARHLGGDSLREWLIAQGWHSEKQASQKGYRILSVTRPE
ncbi:MAG: methyltransferase [Longispora sp.]|nr:methyltransferase [Longispora sp. (in: high G+C Gram-positive bacteria)]